MKVERKRGFDKKRQRPSKKPERKSKKRKIERERPGMWEQPVKAPHVIGSVILVK